MKKIEKKPAIDVFAATKDRALRWQFAEGEILELKKFSDQVVKTGSATQKRSVFHRVLLEAGTPDSVRGYPLAGTFTSLVRRTDDKQAYTEDEKYQAAFYLLPDGEFKVPPGQYMPNIRSVPAFSVSRDPALKDDASMESGATWERPGEEAMKFSNLIQVPFNVHYEYRGTENIKSEEGEKNCHKFIANYELNYGDNGGTPRVFGYVTAVWFWDAAQGIPYYASEEYNVIIVNEQGIANEFKIKSRSYYRKFRARDDIAKVDLAQRLKDNLIKENTDLNVSVTDTGVTISLPDIFFATDSSKLSGDAKDALEKLGSILKNVDSRHIRVRGHTDNQGDTDYNQKLSEARAARVAEYLIDESGLNADALSYDGRGARDPVAPNETTEGRARNRRVEIILLDK
ncbi:MAG: OmpA family protein [Spirochaetes bacterium]|nr:OmpA family protein [Spirochaetota bacterium]